MLKIKTLKYLLNNINKFPIEIKRDIMKESERRSRSGRGERRVKPLPALKEIDYYKHEIIVAEVNKYFGIDIMTKRQFEEIMKGRRIASYLLYKYTSDTQDNKAAFIGLDHASLLYHIKIIKGWLETEDKETIRILQEIEPEVQRKIKLKHIERRNKPVLQIDNITNEILQEFPSVHEAAISCNIRNEDTIRYVCNKRIKDGYEMKTAGGFKWEWAINN